MGTMAKGNKRKIGVYPNIKYNLKLKMITLISLLIIGICIIFAFFLDHFVSDTIEEQVGRRALNLAQSVANIPEIKDAFQLENPSSVIQEIVTPIQENTGAEFIVVGNNKGIRYSHPNESRIGREMVGDDNDRALYLGESYISKREGTLGLSIRGKVPIYSDDQIIGIVSVGFLNENVQETIINQSKSLWYMLGLITLVGVIGAILIANYIKRLLYNMEPEEISYLYVQKEAILQSTHEGLISIDDKGRITTINSAAKEILSNQEKQVDGSTYIGAAIQEIMPHIGNFDILNNSESFFDREMILGETIVLVNQTPIYLEGKITGFLYTFRKKTELDKITEELSRIKQYANVQRALTHEHSNKLHIILGLLQNNRKDKAINFIKRENNLQQDRLTFLTKVVADPLVHALLQGKFNQANELGISMTIDPESQLNYLFSGDKQDAILTALGNVIENAFDAVKSLVNSERSVSIFFTDIGEDILFEIDDSGSGIVQENLPHIFKQGFSTRHKLHRGTGLALTKHVLHEIGGEIILEEGELGGACFIISIPKD